MSYKITTSKQINLTGSRKGVLTISKTKKGETISKKDLENISEMLKKKYKNKDIKYYIKAHGNLTHPITFKSFENEEIDIDAIDDYLEGKVKDKTKFDVLYSVEFGYIVKT